jgi:hypothetical protein
VSFSRRLPLLIAVLFALALVGFSRPSTALAGPAPIVSGSFSPQSIKAGETTTLTIEVEHVLFPITNIDISGPAGSTLISHLNTCAAPNSPPAPRIEPSFCSHTMVWSFSTPGVYGIDDFTISYSDLEGPIVPNGSVDFTLEVLDAAPAVCALTPDLAVSPQLITIAPGEQATVELAMRNLCKDALTVPGDLVISFSDGLTVVDGTNGMRGIAAQRAAVQTFALNGDETRRWTVTVEAGDDLVTAPVHITEYYVLGRVSSRIDGVFITPEPAPAAVVAETAPTAAPAPAPIPAALPNTAGETAPAAAGLPLAALLLTVAAGALLLRRKA